MEATDRKLFGKSSKSKGSKQSTNKGASEVAAIIETVQTLTQAILTDTNTDAATRPGKTNKEETNEDYDVDLIEMLPKPWDTLALANPIVYLVSGLRWTFYGSADVDIRISFAITLAFLAMCVAIIAYIFKTGWRLRE